MDPLADLSLPPDEREAFLRGVDQFNQGWFFECHDTLEEIWQGLRGPGRDFVQGLIQEAVAFHHLGRGNLAGAGSVLTRALGRLGRYPARYASLDLDAHRGELRAWLARIESGEVEVHHRDDLPRWRFGPPGAAPGEGGPAGT